jgi:hypothetical protein
VVYVKENSGVVYVNENSGDGQFVGSVSFLGFLELHNSYKFLRRFLYY